MQRAKIDDDISKWTEYNEIKELSDEVNEIL